MSSETDHEQGHENETPPLRTTKVQPKQQKAKKTVTGMKQKTTTKKDRTPNKTAFH